MPIEFYQVLGSPPCSAVAVTAAAVGVELKSVNVSLTQGEHLKPEYIKMNPQHTVPTIDDNGFYLWESRAIMIYLVETYGKDESLYPKDPKKKALVNQRLFFDQGPLYQSFADYYYPMMFAGAPRDTAKYEKIEAALAILDKFLEGQRYAAGNSLTLADIALATTISNYEVMDIDLAKYKNVSSWFAKIKTEIPSYETIQTGAKTLKAMADKLIKPKN